MYSKFEKSLANVFRYLIIIKKKKQFVIICWWTKSSFKDSGIYKKRKNAYVLF